MATMRSKSSRLYVSIVPPVRMPALLTKMSSVPKASVDLATAARSSLAEALSAFRDNAFPPVDSISLTSWRAFSFELEYVNATDAPSAASRRTMPAPIPLEPPVTRATLPLNDFVCIWPAKPPGHELCHIMDCSVQNETHPHAAESDRRYFQIAFSKFAFLHCFSFWGPFPSSQ